MLAWLGERIDLAALISLGGISGYIVMVLLKHAFGRERPPVGDRLLDIGTLSFPSGHAMLSVIVLGLSGYICYQLYPWVRENRAVLAVVPVLILLIGLSRVYLGVHWLSDVLFGWVFGAFWVGVCLFGLLQLASWIRRRPALLGEMKSRN